MATPKNDAENAKLGLHKNFSDYVESHPIDIYVDYNDELSDSQLELIINGKTDEVRFEIEERYNLYPADGEFDYYWSEMCEALKCTREEVDEWLETEDSCYPWYYLDDHGWKQLLRNSTTNITAIMWDVPYDFYNVAYGYPLEYSDVKEALKVLGIDPFVFKETLTGGGLAGSIKTKGYFPKMSSRVPKCNVKDLHQNGSTFYDGTMTFCLGDIENVSEVLSGNPKHITFKSGTNVVMYNFGGGAFVTEVQLTDDVTVKRKDVEFRIDSQTRYGIQDCAGLTQAFWNEGSIENGK